MFQLETGSGIVEDIELFSQHNYIKTKHVYIYLRFINKIKYILLYRNPYEISGSLISIKILRQTSLRKMENKAVVLFVNDQITKKSICTDKCYLKAAI